MKVATKYLVTAMVFLLTLSTAVWASQSCEVEEILDLLDTYQAAQQNKDCVTWGNLLTSDYHAVQLSFGTVTSFDKAQQINWCNSNQTPFDEHLLYNRNIKTVHNELVPGSNKTLVTYDSHSTWNGTLWSAAAHTMTIVKGTDGVCRIKEKAVIIHAKNY